MDAIFAYGSLMWGESNHALLDGAVLIRVLPAKAPGWMISLGPYPGVVEGEGTVERIRVRDEADGDDCQRTKRLVPRQPPPCLHVRHPRRTLFNDRPGNRRPAAAPRRR